jgi:two-component system LytT family response regulator
MTFRVVIVDDEPRAREGMCALVSQDPDVTIAAECATAEQAIDAIQRLAPDLVFLDVQMPDQNGFDVLSALDVGRPPVVVFVTAYDQYAVQAFETNAVDYLLKPFSNARLMEALARAKDRCRAGAADPRPGSYLRRFFVRAGRHVDLIPADHVDWIEAEGYHVILHVVGAAHRLRGHLGRFETQLDPACFCRISRAAIVNVTRVERLKEWYEGEGLVVLRDGTELKASRAHRKRLEALLRSTPGQ